VPELQEVAFLVLAVLAALLDTLMTEMILEFRTYLVSVVIE
jgi:hypothetical protein